MPSAISRADAAAKCPPSYGASGLRMERCKALGDASFSGQLQACTWAGSQYPCLVTPLTAIQVPATCPSGMLPRIHM